MQPHDKRTRPKVRRPNEGHLLKQLRSGRGGLSQRRDWLRDAVSEYRCYGELFLAAQVDIPAGECLPDSSPTDRSQKDDRVAALARLDRCAASLHLSPPGDEWHEVSGGFAREHLSWVLGHSLAYSGPPVMPAELASELSGYFFELFDADARAFTNFKPAARPCDQWHRGVHGWMALTSHVFDTGVALLDAQRVGLLWLAEDD